MILSIPSLFFFEIYRITTDINITATMKYITYPNPAEVFWLGFVGLTLSSSRAITRPIREATRNNTAVPISVAILLLSIFYTLPGFFLLRCR